MRRPGRTFRALLLDFRQVPSGPAEDEPWLLPLATRAVLEWLPLEWLRVLFGRLHLPVQLFGQVHSELRVLVDDAGTR